MKHAEITEMILPVIQELGYELWGCEYLTQGRYSLLRIYIDKNDGILVEDCEKVSRQVSALLDVEDPITGNYTLEVSSPGIPRPLFYPYQYQLFIGANVQLKLIRPVSGQRKFTGKILSANDEAVVLELGNEQLKVEFSNIAKAYLTDE